MYKWYKKLRKLKGKIQEGVHDDDMAEFHSELERIDTDVRKVKIPWAYAEELYQLRLHIRYVREGLDRQPTTTGGTARRSEALEARAVKSSALEDAS